MNKAGDYLMINKVRQYSSEFTINNLLIIIMLFTITGCIYKTELPLLTKKIQEQRPILIRNAKLFTGKPDQKKFQNVNILIHNDRIVKISTDKITDRKAQVINAEGKMVIPGLIDAHTHTHMTGAPPSMLVIANPERNLSAFLYAGITTVFDLGGPLDKLEDAAKKLQTGQITGPRLYYAGKLLTSKGGHPASTIRMLVPWPLEIFAVSQMVFEIGEGDDVKKMIRENKEHGARFTKAVLDYIPVGSTSLNDKQLSRIVKDSRLKDLQTVVHIGSEKDILKALKAGVRFFVHVPYRSKLSEKTIRIMKQHNAVVSTTLAVFDNLAKLTQDKLIFSKLDKEIADPVILKAYKKQPLADVGTSFQKWLGAVVNYKDVKFENIRKMKHAGINLIAASDSPNVGSFPGSTLHRELELLVKYCNFTPQEAVAAATYIPGKLYTEMTGQPQLGYLQEGSPADLIILNGDFRKDISQTQNINTLILKGKLIQRIKP